ncbi:t-SNARE [Trichodelitschia bisporula]|uniref:t-SNARE n=1 Tax=Trichodelitschia bisporula TaxID=703511 RepID=A0A6G1HNL8_9PEZI|nr:t-SNARE [Trichodelitschia bisporula]
MSYPTTAVRPNIQDRTPEFRTILHRATQRQPHSKKLPPAQQSLLSSSERSASTPATRSEFARRAATIGRGLSSTMSKLERLAALARRKTLFDDRPVEINELTFVIKQDLARLDQDIRQLQSLSQGAKQPAATADHEREHNRNVLFLLKGKLGSVGAAFKDTLELRTRNIQASRERTENFITSVGNASAPSSLIPSRTDSPLYQPPAAGSARPKSPYANAAASDVLSLDMPTGQSSALARTAPHSQQLLLMEEGSSSNAYIQARGEAVETIERTINELGGLFSQLAQMVSEQGEQIQRIDADTDDVLDNVAGAQRELLKYWSRVQGNRWLVAKMFGVLMIFFLLWVLIAG